MKSESKNPTLYAKTIYMADNCYGNTAQYTDHAIVDCRVRAFVDGVNWQKRQARRRRALNRT
jgi:hypothetical protein